MPDATAQTPPADADLEATTWRLGDLVADRGEAGVDALLEEGREAAAAFAQEYRGTVADLDAEGLAAAMHALEAISDRTGRGASFAMLRFSEATHDPAAGALLQRAQERATAIETELVFFQLEWTAVPDDRAEELLADPRLEFCAHYLREARRLRDHQLSEPEEKLMSEKSISASDAWSRLFDEQVSAITVAIGDDAPVSFELALSELMAPDRERRRAVAEGVTTALEPGLRTRAFIYNTLLHDKSVDDRLRGFPHWLSARNIANEISDASVDALVEAVRARYDIPQRYYRLKARLLGVDRIADYDRAAHVGDEEEKLSWGEARELVLDTYGGFSQELGDLVGRFFDEHWIDAPMREGKRPGAFCAYTVPSAHPYVLLNYTSRRRDVLTLAHELGHGVHAALAAPRGVFHHSTPLTVCETASVFGETLTFGRLLEAAASPESRLTLLAARMDDAIATVFRQTAMHRFEDLVHTSRRAEGELSVDRFGELWTTSQGELFGDAVEMTEGYRTWWSYVPHFIASPGYVYAYAYGQLLALSIYRQYEQEGDGFVPRYLDLLKAGGSRSPDELAAIVGLDLADPGFWASGLELIDAELGRAEDAAREAGHV